MLPRGAGAALHGPVAGPQLGTALGSLGMGEQGLLPPLPSSPSRPTAKGRDSSAGARLCPSRVCAAQHRGWEPSGGVLRWGWGSASVAVRRCSKAFIDAKRGGEKQQAPYWQTNSPLSGGKTDFAEICSCTRCGFWPYGRNVFFQRVKIIAFL